LSDIALDKPTGWGFFSGEKWNCCIRFHSVSSSPYLTLWICVFVALLHGTGFPGYIPFPQKPMKKSSLLVGIQVRNYEMCEMDVSNHPHITPSFHNT
jgi:hypothetical protein